jgi:hypothetical protein
MAWSARMRWIAYGIAALGTVAAMRWVDEAAVQEHAVVKPAAPRPVAQNAPEAGNAPNARTASGLRAASDSQASEKRPVPANEVRLDWLARAPMRDVKGDPFSDGPAEPPPPATLREAPPPPPPPPPQAPPLPFTYVGKWIENGQTTVFLARGGNNVAVRGVGKLDDTYAVESIDDKRMVLKYLPLNQPQVLSLVAPQAGAPSTEQVATAPSESGEGTEEGSN